MESRRSPRTTVCSCGCPSRAGLRFSVSVRFGYIRDRYEGTGHVVVPIVLRAPLGSVLEAGREW